MNFVVMANDIEVILRALSKEREDLHQQLMQLDRIINRVKTGNYEGKIEAPKPIVPIAPVIPKLHDKPKTLPESSNLKVQMLRIFDVIGVACRMRDIQDEFTKLSGKQHNIREIVRGLQIQGLVYLIKEKHNLRGFAWAKKEWVENGILLDKHKPEGFDLLHHPDNIICV